MIEIVNSSILQNTSFLSKMKGTLISDYFDKFNFGTEEEIKAFGRLWELKILSCFLPEGADKDKLDNEFKEKISLVNSALRGSLDALMEHLIDPELYINADYVKSDAEFTLTEQDKALDEVEFSHLVNQSFRQEIANFMLERASSLQKLNSAECLQAINNSTKYHYLAAQNKIKRQQVNEPQSNEKRSTQYPKELIDKVGGEERFEQWLALLANDKQCFDDVREVNGAIRCVYKDEQDFKWNVQIELKDHFQILLNNQAEMQVKDLQGVSFSMGPGMLDPVSEFPSSTISSGAYPLAITTIHDFFATYIKGLATAGIFQLHFAANQIPDNMINMFIKGLLETGECPRRSELPVIVQQLVAQAPMLQIVLNSLLNLEAAAEAQSSSDNQEGVDRHVSALAINGNVVDEQSASELEPSVPAAVTHHYQLRSRPVPQHPPQAKERSLKRKNRN